jgi:DNA modification methylase
MLTDEGDLVIDPFAGSCVTGAVSERLGRKWVCCDTNEEYLLGAIGRFADLEVDAERLYVRKEYTITAPNFSSSRKPKKMPLALQNQFDLFDHPLEDEPGT